MSIKFRFVIYIFLILPLLISSSNVRKRRRPGLEDQVGESKDSYPDQIALATRYRQTKYIPSEETDSTENHQDHRNLFPSTKTYPDELKSKFLEENLANSNSAQEYVQKAIQLHINHQISPSHAKISISKSQPNPDINFIPDSSSPKYEVFEKEDLQTEAPIPYFEKDSVTRSSYDVFDFSEHSYHKPQLSHSGQKLMRFQSTNFDNDHNLNQPQTASAEEPDQSSSNEMPKEEILKHIEESVIKYMRTLEAEGKITTQEPKVYYKIQHHPTESGKPYRAKPKGSVSQSESGFKISHPLPNNNNNNMKILYKDEQVFQPSNLPQNSMENISENVEFVYKINARPSLKHKHASNSQKNIGNFAQESTIKHIQDIDISQLIPEERPTQGKLFFNSETYRDINSLPYKHEKILIRPEFKEREQRRPVIEYKPQQETRQDGNHQSQEVDEGYPIMNPYRFILRKEPVPKFENEEGVVGQSSNWQPYIPNNQETSGIQFDSYNPRHNNNPDGYGYQHNYKLPLRPSKRGKRIQGSKKHIRTFSNPDAEASVALRPPPKSKQS